MLNPGDTLGPYVIEAQLASGGMGVVLRARNRVTGQLRALKVVRSELAGDPDFVDRFVREATIASQLRHPNLVETFEPGIDGSTIYLPMELLEGETLMARLHRVQRLSLPDASSIVVAIADAVQLLHDRSLVHRDLKPGNVFLAREGGRDVPKVIDLGTARDVDDDEHTRTGMVIGSPFYMALEQAEGRRDIDARADQYALGVIAYQLVTGLRPYESDDTRSALARLLRGDAYLPPSAVAPGLVPPAVEEVIVRALERDRDLRFASIRDLGRAFATAVERAIAAADAGSDVVTAVRSPPRRAVGPRREAASVVPRWALIAGAVSVAVVVASGVAAWAMTPPAQIVVVQLPIERISGAIAAPTQPAQVAVAAPVVPAQPELQPQTLVEPDSAEPAAAEPDAPVRGGRAKIRRPRARARTEGPPCGATIGIPCTR